MAQPEAAPSKHNTTKSVAIIGAGWTGLQTLQSLRERGFEKVTIYKEKDSVGGTWHPENKYVGLGLHSPIRSASFENFPFSDDPAENNKRQPSDAVHKYFLRYIEAKGIEPYIKYNSKITEIHQYDGRAYLQLAGADTMEGPFDFVLFASFAKSPSMPYLKYLGKKPDEKKPLVLHSNHMTRDMVDRIKAEGKKVIVLGGSKSAADMVVMLDREGVPLTQCYRGPYFFIKLERFQHSQGFWGKLQSIITMMAMMIFRYSSTWGVWAVYMTGYLYVLKGEHNWNGNRFHNGVLDKDQVETIKSYEPVIGELAGFDEHGLVMEDGRKVEGHVIVCATGYKTGIDEIKLVKDGQVVDINKITALYDHLIPPEFQTLGIASCQFYIVGPVRGVTTAQYLDLHLNRQYPLSVADMTRAAEKLKMKQTLTKNILFDSNSSLVQSSASYWIDDLIGQGYASFGEFQRIGYTSFVLNQPVTPCSDTPRKAMLKCIATPSLLFPFEIYTGGTYNFACRHDGYLMNRIRTTHI